MSGDRDGRRGHWRAGGGRKAPKCLACDSHVGIATTGVLAHVEISALLKNTGSATLRDGTSVLFEYTLPDGPRFDYVLSVGADGPMATRAAKPAA